MGVHLSLAVFADPISFKVDATSSYSQKRVIELSLRLIASSRNRRKERRRFIVQRLIKNRVV